MSGFGKIPFHFALFTALLAPAAFATSNQFPFYGYGQPPSAPGGPPAEFSGVINFSTTASGIVSTANLTSFSLTDVYGPIEGPGSNNWSYGVGDLLSFAFDAPTRNLQLQTDSIAGKQLSYVGEVFVNTTGNGGDNAVELLIRSPPMPWATASLTFAPEPRSWALIGIPLLALFLAALRKRHGLSAS